LRRFIERYLPAKRFEDLRVPLTILATDIDTGKGIRLEQGDLTEAILASVAIPRLLPPVIHEGRQLIDGGITNNLPLDVAVEKGATTALAIRCRCERTRREPVHGIANILLRSFDITDSLKYEQDAHRYNGVCEMIMLTPCFDFDVGFLDFRHTGKLIDMAYEATIRARDEFMQLIASRQTRIAADLRAQISTSVLRESSKSEW
jgi:NTE family protein